MGLGTAEDYQLVKYDNNGNLQWVKRYNSPHNNVDIANDMDVDIAGNVYVTGQSYLNNSSIISYFTIKYNSAGTELWTKRSGLDARNDVATSISVDKSQNAYVSGISNGVTIAGLTYKYDINGNEVWAASYVNQQDIPIVRVVDEDDEADESNIVVSTSNNEFYQTTGYDYLTIKYNGISGDTLWNRRFNHINSFDNVHAMTVDSDGNVYVTGKSYDNISSFDMATIKYDGISGSTLWYQRYNAGGDDLPNDIAIGLDGAVYLAGQNSYGSLQVLKYFQSNPLPTVTVSPDVSICSGSSATLTAGGAITYEWSPSTGLNTTTGTSVVASPSSTTTYTVTGTDANGYTNTATVTVTVNPLPTVTASPNVSICSGSSATLTGSGAGTYEWSPSTGLNGETTQSINVTPSSTTAYTVTVTNASGCSSSDQVEVEVIPVSISVNAGEDQSIYGGCVTQSATLTASASGGFGSTYFWSPGGETTQSITVTPSGTTTYTVTVTNSLGCSSSDEVIVNVTPVSISVDAGDDQSLFAGCSTQGTTITASVAGGFDPTYFWSPGGETTQTISVNPSSTTTYTVTVTNSFGCSSSDEVVVNVTPVDLSVNAGSDTTIYLGYGPQSTTLTAEASGGNSPSYLWSPGGATTQSITVSPSTTTVYTVQVTNSIGCVTTDEVQVFVYDTRCGNNGNKVLVCHNGKTICISESAVSSHLNHGDHLDSCNGGPDNMMGVEIISEIPDDYMLHANYPNPFNPVTTMKYDLPFDSEVTLTVYDMLGREVVTLVNEMKSAGRYSVTFNAAGLPSGMYFYKIKAHDFVQVRKMILLK